MDTPAPSNHDGLRALYGAPCPGINRRWLLGAIAALPVAAQAAGKRPVVGLRWDGTAKIMNAYTALTIGIRTQVEPFVRARSDSWLLSEGPAKRRSIIIEPSEAFIERFGKREPMPAAMALHERQQYAAYGYVLEQAPVVSRGRNTRRLQREGYPPAELHFTNGRLTAIDYVVAPPDPGKPIAQRFTFDGEIVSNGVRWPRVIRIAQNGQPYFELTLTSFEAVRA